MLNYKAQDATAKIVSTSSFMSDSKYSDGFKEESLSSVKRKLSVTLVCTKSHEISRQKHPELHLTKLHKAHQLELLQTSYPAWWWRVDDLG